MAKKNAIPGPSTAELMGVAELPAHGVEVSGKSQMAYAKPPEPAAEQSPEPEPPAEVMISAYVSRGPINGYVSRRFEAHLTDQQAKALRSLRNGLHERHEKLANGHHVDTVADAVRWILERLSNE
jgi:hypothetical protein